MQKHKLVEGTVHKLPKDFAVAISSSKSVTKLWQYITPLARNEWICWVEEAKKAETRERRIKVGLSKMTAGERRPCCWMGCIHRPDKPLSPSIKGILARRNVRR
jgi:Bacteriocin-protection, YdeI or OmpD-Associated